MLHFVCVVCFKEGLRWFDRYIPFFLTHFSPKKSTKLYDNDYNSFSVGSYFKPKVKEENKGKGSTEY